ncbi:MAG: STAS domain-containing protein [Chloroflexota bacterium]
MQEVRLAASEPRSARARRAHGPPLDCDVRALPHPDVCAVDALARLALVARRHGRDIRIHGASDELRSLIDLAGLGSVLVSADELALEAGRQPEQREEPGGVEEERDPGDPLA